MKKVSFIVPVYNQEELLERCIKSIPKRWDIEIIIVDDGSTDKTPNIIADLVQKYPEYIGAILCGTNHGVSYARNLGIEKATGEYLIFVDSDDYLDLHKTSLVIDSFLAGQWDMVFYDMMTNNKIIYRSTRENRKTRYGMFKFIKKSFIGDTRFPLDMNYAEDRVFHQELMEKKPNWVCSGVMMYYYNYPREGSLCYLHDKEVENEKQCRTSNTDFNY